MKTKLHFYAGCQDGATILAEESVQTFDLPHLLPSQPRVQYFESLTWSDHFGRRTAVPDWFKQQPPPAKACA